MGGLAINCSTGQPLADCAANRLIGALLIINPKRDSVAIAEIEFGKVAVQMALVAVLIHADHSALEDGEEALGAVHMGFAARPFRGCVIYAAVSREAPPDRAIGVAFVGHQFAVGVSVVEYGGSKSGRLQIVTLTGRARPPRSTKVTIPK